jgi:hypothetical protein
MSNYIGAKYTGNDPVTIGASGSLLKPGDITKEVPEWEAIGRHDFEPVYEGISKQTKPASAGK